MHQDLNEGQLTISAEPSSAIMHKAIEDTADDIDHELRICERLSRELPFGHDRTTGGSLPHRWNMGAVSIRNIRPKPGTYEYIPGSFRPNTSRLLQLLTGSKLYGDKLVAVRELIQNGFDSVSEQIAREQIVNGRHDAEYADLVAARHSIELQFEVGPEATRIICRDTGVGMSKDIITNRLLVSGSGPDSKLVKLQMECRQAGVRLNRSGQFGIGVLSYFMLSDHLVFQTRRSQEAGTEETNGWEFETWGAGEFGELRRCSPSRAGTTVILELRSGLLDKKRANEFYTSLIAYLKARISWLPCQLSVASNLSGTPVLHASRGWFVDQISLVQAHAARRYREPSDREKIINALEWIMVDEELPDKLGRVRLCQPWFKTPFGPSLGYIADYKDGSIRGDKAGNIYVPSFTTRYSWYGMVPDDERGGPATSGAMIEIDLRSAQAGTPNVSRTRLLIDERVRTRIVTYVDKRLSSLRRAFVTKQSTTELVHINAAIAGVAAPPSVPLHWAVLGRRNRFRVERIAFPATIHNALFARYAGLVGCRIGDQQVTVCGSLKIRGERQPERQLEFFQESQLPDRCLPTVNLTFCPIWDSVLSAPRGDERVNLISLPSEWRDLLTCKLPTVGPTFVNRGHPLVTHLFDELEELLDFDEDDEEEDIHKVFDEFRKGLDGALAGAATAKRWLFRVLTHSTAVYEIWDRLARERTRDLTRLWSLGFGDLGGMPSVLRLTLDFEGDDDWPVLEEISVLSRRRYRLDRRAARSRFGHRLSAPESVMSVALGRVSPRSVP